MSAPSASQWDFPAFLATPPANARPVPFHEPSPDQETKVQRVVDYFGAEGYVVPEEQGGGEKGRLSEWEMMFLSREGIIRFLIATKWDQEATITRLEKCLVWRRKEQVDDVQAMADKVEAEYARTGGQIILGYTTHANPVIVMQVNKRDTPPSHVGLLQLFFLLERSIDLMPAGVTKTSFIVDFIGKRKYTTPLSLAKEWVNVLQDCYPERLAIGAIVNIPWVINLFLQAVYVFLDPVTKSKIVLNPSLRPLPPATSQVAAAIANTKEESAWPPASLSLVIPPDQSLAQYGGSRELVWTEETHKAYWGALVSVCLRRREEARQRWRELGGRVGRSEFAFKSG